MPDVRGCFLDGEPISVQEKLERIASRFIGLSIILEQLEQIRVLEVLLKVLLIIAIAAGINRSQIHSFLVDLAAINFLFDCAHGNQSVDYNVFLLANPENPINSLIIVRRVPVGIQYDGTISTG